MGGQLDGNFLPGSLPHKFILIVISFVFLWWINFSLSPVCLTIISRHYMETDARTGLGFGKYFSFTLLQCVITQFGYLRKRCYFPLPTECQLKPLSVNCVSSYNLQCRFKDFINFCFLFFIIFLLLFMSVWTLISDTQRKAAASPPSVVSWTINKWQFGWY